MDQPAWMGEAWRKLGVREIQGARHAQDILGFFRDSGHSHIVRDEVAWCAAFVGACLERAGIAATGSLLARSYLDWGGALEKPRLGAVAILKRGDDPRAGHVGFWIGETQTAHVLIGGNQSDAVTVQRFGKDRLLGFRWPHPPDSADSALPSAAAAQALPFARALQHVLEMEGGFTDDPDDPGGPTNKGITLEVYCRHTAKALNDRTRSQRIAQLRDISDAHVRDIYRERYWTPSRAPEMPAAIAFMHFDASVNHGLTGAARLLQRALKRDRPGLDVDGEIGPLTMAAITSARSPEMRAHLLARYANARRAKYRSLNHFWKFGRGWLSRVDKTATRARPWLRHAAPSRTVTGPKPITSEHGLSTNDRKKGNQMTEHNGTATSRKWWGSSLTIWGTLITALTTVVPVLGPAVGIDVTPDMVRQAGEQVVAVIQAIGGLIGILMTIYGRARATNGLERRQVRLQL